MNEYINKLKAMYEKEITSDQDRKVIVDNFYNQMTLNTQKNRN